MCQRIICAMAMLALALIATEVYGQIQPGGLDPSFSGDGKLTDMIAGTTDRNYFVSTVVQPDGKIVAVGNVWNAPRFVYVVRYNQDGSPDTGFGEAGKVSLQFGPFYNYAYDVALQPDGKLLIAGCYCEEDIGDYNLALARLNGDGSLDTTFDGDGRVLRPDLVGPAYSVAVMSDGRVMVSGQTEVGLLADWTVVRFNANGSLDTSFNGTGYRVTPDLGPPTSIVIQPDGKAVAAGYTEYNPKFVAARYNVDGSLDASFDGDGIVITHSGLGDDRAADVLIQPDGKVVVGGCTSELYDSDCNYFLLVRYNSNGSLDNTFDTDGIVSTPILNAFAKAEMGAMALEPGGKIIAAGWGHQFQGGRDFALVRYQPNGALDTTFGGDGKVLADLAGSNDVGVAMATDPNGRAVVVGSSDNKFAVARFQLGLPSKRNGRIAFTSDRDGNREIYVMNADGTGQTRLTNNSIVDDFPTWSPDGRRLAFLSQRTGGGFSIFTMNADGSDRVEVTAVTYTSPSPWRGFDWRHMSWSPDGMQLVFTDLVGITGTLFVVNADGTNRRQLTTGFYPAWSPDGSKIMFVKGGSPNPFYNLFTIRSDGSQLQFIPTSFPNGYILWDTPPIWSPDGLSIALAATDSANSEIYLANPDGSNPRSFTGICAIVNELVPQGCGANTAYPAWSPDGSLISFAQGEYATQSTEIFAKRIGGGPIVQITNTLGNNSNPSWQPLPVTTSFDYDGDGRTDYSVFRPSQGIWYLQQTTAGTRAMQFGVADDKLTPADYDGDGRTDIAVFRPATGAWYTLNSANSTVSSRFFGVAEDLPTPGDYDGDGKADVSVFRPSQGIWYRQNSSNGSFPAVQFGQTGDVPTPGDFDGDGKSDIGVYRPSTSDWYHVRSFDGGMVAERFGQTDDRIAPADYDGDGKTDIAIFRPFTGLWAIRYSSSSTYSYSVFGLVNDIPVPGDYDGDGKADIAVWRPTNGTWFMLQSSNSQFTSFPWGQNGDRPTPAAFGN